MSEVTQLLEAVAGGDAQAADALYLLVYDELRRLAAARMARERPGHTLQATALVHEVWLRMEGAKMPVVSTSNHFFAAAVAAMRRILIEQARRRLTAKRGGGQEAVDLDEVVIESPAARDEQLLAVDDALEKLSRVDPRKAELVRLRYFVGLSFEEAATALGIGVPTAKQWWTYARAWLPVELGPAQSR